MVTFGEKKKYNHDKKGLIVFGQSFAIPINSGHTDLHLCLTIFNDSDRSRKGFRILH